MSPTYDPEPNEFENPARTPAFNSGRTPGYDTYDNNSPTYDPEPSTKEELGDASSPTYDSPPHSYAVPTPGALLNPTTPGAYHVDTPSQFVAPMTPGSGGGFDITPASPYVGGGGYNQSSNSDGLIEAIPDHFLAQGIWIVENLYVVIKDHKERYNGREAIVKDVADGKKTMSTFRTKNATWNASSISSHR